MTRLTASLMTAIGIAAAVTSCSAPAHEAAPADKQMAVQLYSLRELVGDSARYAANHDSVFALLAGMGYTAVEAANYSDGRFYGIAPAQFRADCEAAGLVPLSSHATRNLTADELAAHDFTAALAWWDDAIAAHKEAGMTYLITPWCYNPATPEDAAVLCDYFNTVGQKVREAGLTYGYHTHSQEFQPIPGTDTLWIDYMMENVDPANMFWQMDTYWAVMAGKSPVEFLEKYPGRFTLLHIKDKYELGQSGMVNFEPIFNAAADAGLKGFVVEQEGASAGNSIIESVAADAAYLRQAPFVKAAY